MCTVSWSLKKNGGLNLCFNRDEKHQRPAGLPPRLWPEGILAPVDPLAGGTWIAIRLDGMVLALLNHYPRGYIPQVNNQSRGQLIPLFANATGHPEISTLKLFKADSMNPFRLLSVSPSGHSQVITWDGNNFSQQHNDENYIGMLTSSSWNTSSVVTARHREFRQWIKSHPTPDLSAHLAYHTNSFHKRGSAWAVCMSREEARSVSLNAITVSGSNAAMTHQLRPEGTDEFQHTTHHTVLSLCNNTSSQLL